MIEFVRIDDKLVHAQIVWGWARMLNASCIIVANDEAAHNSLRRKMITMAAKGVGPDSQSPDVRILSLEEAAEELKITTPHECSILVVSRPSDLVFLVDNHVTIHNVSVGWMSFLPGKRRILDTVSVDEEDMEAFRILISKGINVKYQASPSDVQLDMADYI